ncbi:helix-turn-helix domain-containing protein [Sinorhizobium meliloti]|uniref:helix-turn-helix domain-containing protein n=2 Tax=Rhizobium meliloti TaxID=382 RepID=UPI002D76961A|nr:helix-turn-helix transcriptional regulator [Sinorhizobium meliloti]
MRLIMTPAQCRAARALLDWTQPHLAEAAGVSPSTLRDFESGKRIPIANNLAAIRAALETVGVTFLEDGDVAAGSGVAMHPTN